jgi:SAM-dependent methyltransferase
MWYTDWFSSKYYLELYKHRDDEDARNLINLIQRAIHFSTDARVLDICCGAGRHSIELAKRGFNVTGFDLSRYLISAARWNLKRAKERNLKVKFLIKDMRHFNFKESFDAAVNVFTSFGYFEDDAENFTVFNNAYSSLSRGGWFVFDYLNETYLRENIVPSSRDKFGDKTVVQKRRIENDFVIKEITIKEGSKERNYREILKLYTYKELRGALEDTGFEITAKYGDYYGNPFSTAKSKRLVLFARKL